MTRPSDITEAAYEWADIFCDEHRHIEDDRELVARAFMLATQMPAPSRLGLTALQSKGLDFIAAYQRKHGASPSFSDIAAHLGITSRGAIHGLVHQLVDRGVISMAARRARSIVVVGQIDNVSTAHRISVEA